MQYYVNEKRTTITYKDNYRSVDDDDDDSEKQTAIHIQVQIKKEKTTNNLF